MRLIVCRYQRIIRTHFLVKKMDGISSGSNFFFPTHVFFDGMATDNGLIDNFIHEPFKMEDSDHRCGIHGRPRNEIFTLKFQL